MRGAPKGEWRGGTGGWAAGVRWTGGPTGFGEGGERGADAEGGTGIDGEGEKGVGVGGAGTGWGDELGCGEGEFGVCGEVREADWGCGLCGLLGATG